MRAAIGGIFNRDGSPVDPQELKQFGARALLPSGSFPVAILRPAAGLVWVPAVNSAASAPAPSDRYDVVVDGTLDNRAELASMLGLPPEGAGPGSEPWLISSVYERWGESGFGRLIGEFAFLLWDRGEQRLLAVRDTFGLRELFYREDETELRIASQLQMLLRPSVTDLDEEYVADFLTGQVSFGQATPFKGVRRLPAGHQLSLAGGRLSIQPTWELTEQPLLSYRRDSEYLDHFLATFEEAVGRSLATGGRVWAELSGGLDSSSIVCVAQEILRGDPIRARDFATMTFVWDETPQSDERRWSRQVVEKYGLINHQVICDDLFFDRITEASLYRNEPHFGLFTYPMFRAQTELLRGSGVEVLLCGSRAESVVLSDLTPPLHLADHLRALRLGDFGRELLRWQRGTHQPFANLLISFALKPLLRPGLYMRSSEDDGTLDSWVSPVFARRMDLHRRVRRVRTERRFHSLARQLQYERLRRSEQMVHRGYQEWACEVRHPFLYRPLVELVMRIPWERKVDPGMGKSLLRDSLSGRLPEGVRTRRGGAGPGPAAYKAYAKRWDMIAPVVRSSLLASLGFLDGAEFNREAEMVRFGSSNRFGAFTSALAFEFWLRAVTGSREGQDAVS